MSSPPSAVIQRRAMKFSLGYPIAHHPMDDAFVTPDFLAEFARVAEECGYHSVNVTEHPMPGDRWLAAGGHHAPDPFVTLAFAAAATEHIRVLTNLTVVPYRNPFLLAKAAASLDRVSGGRLTLGVGTGYLKPEFFALGVDFDERNDLFDESLEACRLAWSGKSVTFEGRHFSARDTTAHPTPVQDPVPIWIGGNSALTRRRVAASAQGWMPMLNPPEFAAARRSALLENLDDLARMLDDLRDKIRANGRTEAIDIMFMSFEGGLPGTDYWEPARLLADLRAQADLGVNWQQITAAGDTPEAVLSMVRRYADDIVHQLA
jgi:probable F420-dependent oxidoreductase